MRSRLLLILGFVLLASISSASARPQIFNSPDHALYATITKNKTHEAHVIIRSRKVKILLNRNFFSPGGTHGRVVEHAAWTPDSQYFVFATYSSGGLQSVAFTDFVLEQTCAQADVFG